MAKASTPKPHFDAVQLTAALRTPEGRATTDRELALKYGAFPKDVARIRHSITQETLSAMTTPVSEPTAPALPNASPAPNGDVDRVHEDPMVPDRHHENGDISDVAADLLSSESVPANVPDSAPSESQPIVMEPGRRELRLDQIDVTSGTQVRDIDIPTVDHYAEILEKHKTTAVFPPLEVYYVTDLDPPKFCLTSGFHRREASLRVLGETCQWSADVHVGTLRDAIGASMRHNRTHGRPLTTEERTAIVERVLADDYWGKWNDSKLEALTGEDRRFIGLTRKAWHKKQGSKGPDKTLVERGGKTYEQKATQEHPRGKADQSNGDETDASDPDTPGSDGITPDQRKADANLAYLESLPARDRIHEELRPDFDAAALAVRELMTWFSTANNWCKRHEGDLGAGHPFYEAIERTLKIARPWPMTGEEKNPVWLACSKCSVQGVSVGVVDNKACPKCEGRGFTGKF